MQMLIILFISICEILPLGIQGESPPSWPDAYTVSGILELPYAEIQEPFTAYYDKSINRSRIDFYDSTVKTMTNGTDNGISFKVTPVTTENTTNVQTCFQVPGDVNNTIDIQSVLPDLTNFTLLNKNNDTTTWHYIEMIEERKNTYTLIVSTEGDTITPVRYEMIGYNSLLGSHYDRYYVTYTNYEHRNGSIPLSVFDEVTKGLKCQNFSDTDSAYINHRITTNPMSEYINRDEQHVHELFQHFTKTHDKNYVSKREHHERKEIFRQNLRLIRRDLRLKEYKESTRANLRTMPVDSEEVIIGQRGVASTLAQEEPIKELMIEKGQTHLFRTRQTNSVVSNSSRFAMAGFEPFRQPTRDHRSTFKNSSDGTGFKPRTAREPQSYMSSQYESQGLSNVDQFQRKTMRPIPGARTISQRRGNTRSIRFIHSTNRAGNTYQVDVNHLADYSDKEISLLRGKKITTHYNGGQEFITKVTQNTPDQWDWRLFGAVTPVKDQAVCGSCWSFGTTGTVEGTNFVKTGKLLKLSEQELVDCSWGEGNNACDGGEDWRAYQWIIKHGLSTTEQYGPYRGQNGLCGESAVNGTVKVSGYVNVTRNNPDALKVALVKYGPISVSIDASRKTLSFYSNGVYYEPTCANNLDGLDHSVLLVGYGVLNGQTYWLIKNSWSTYWGNDGYILMAQKDNNCGVMTIPTYPIIQ